MHLSTTNYFESDKSAAASAALVEPLKGHEDFAAATIVDFRAQVAAKLGAQRVWTDSDNDFEVRTSQYGLPSGALWHVQNRAPLCLECGDAAHIRVQIQRAGSGRTTIDSRALSVSDTKSCISPAQATLEYGAGFRHVAWHVRTDVLVRKLVALTGFPVTRPLVFEPVVNRGTPESGAFLAILNSILANIDYVQAAAPLLFIAELEHALMISLLQTCPHSLTSLLESSVPCAGPWQVRQVEEYIATHWNAPFDIEQIAALTGMSARSIYRAFKRTRGYSPKAFARQRRLQQARLLLEEDPRDQNVTSVAFACGFTDASHFSREFSKAYGESPSTILARNRRALP
ncbi:MAG: helix-turn-helix transcriptional regulator [Proteobacteria bacterium]|nr:helix-turn-helix transcriptional regulator [Pseudomonadota bacterium]